MGNSPNTGNQEVNVPARGPKNRAPDESRAKFTNWLENFPFAIKPQQKQSVINAAKLLEVESDRFLLRKDESAGGIFVVLSGKFDVIGEGEKFVLREMGEGDCFGEVSVMYEMACTASVRSSTRGSVMQLKSEDVHRFFFFPARIPKMDYFVKKKYVDCSGIFERSKLSKQITLDLLTKAPIFQGWDEKAIKDIVESLKERPITLYPSGSCIFLEGFGGSEMFILVSGRVQFSTKDQELAIFDAGENGFCFGEEGLLTKTKRRSSVRALSPCQVIVLNADNFHNALNKNQAEKMLLQLTHQKWKEHISKRSNELYEEYGGALDMEILRMALKQTRYFSKCLSGLIYIIALSITVKEIREEQAVLSHKQYTEGDWLFLVLKGSAMLIDDDTKTEQELDVQQVFRKTLSLPSNGWVKANERSVVAFFPWSAVTEAQGLFPEVVLDQEE